jgi:hypothetical protein
MLKLLNINTFYLKNILCLLIDLLINILIIIQTLISNDQLIFYQSRHK